MYVWLYVCLLMAGEIVEASPLAIKLNDNANICAMYL